MLQTSSPSYILMAGIDRCVGLLEREKEISKANEKGQALLEKEQYGFRQYVARLERLRTELQESLQNLKLVEPETPNLEMWSLGKSGLKIGYMEYDKSKILISTKRCSKTSEEIYKLLLEKYHLQMEMRAGSYILAMTSIADTDAGFERLKQALLELDKSCRFISTERTEGAGVSFALPRT